MRVPAVCGAHRAWHAHMRTDLSNVPSRHSICSRCRHASIHATYREQALSTRNDRWWRYALADMTNVASTIGLIGSGNMASAMVSGWVKADPEMAGRILVTDRGSGRADALAAEYGVRHVVGNHELVEASDMVVLAVKPVDVERVLREISDLITPTKAIASVAAGVRIATLETILDVDAPVFRFMPKSACEWGRGRSRSRPGGSPTPQQRRRCSGCSRCWARSCRWTSGCSTPPPPCRDRGPRFSV